MTGYQKLKAEIKARDEYEQELENLLKQLKIPESILEATRMKLVRKLWRIYKNEEA